MKTCVNIFYRLHSTHHDIVTVIGTSLHHLEELILVHLDLNYDDAIRFLVRGCPKLKILHVGRGVTIDAVEYLLLGLPNLREFKHPLMVLALERIIQNGGVDEVSFLRTLYIDEGSKYGSKFGRKFVTTDFYKSAQTVMNHLISITKLDISVLYKPCKAILTTFVLTVSTMSQLTELTSKEERYTETCDDTIVLILEAVGHQLKLLDLYCSNLEWLDVIDQCRKLRVLRIFNRSEYRTRYTIDQSYGSDLHEQFTPFQLLQELYLTNLYNSHLKPALFKSLIASPVLQELKLVSIPIFTDDIVEAAFNHVTEDEEQLAFTSLRKLVLWKCDFISKYLENIVTHDRVPLELLVIQRCSGLTERHLWNMERFDMEFIDLDVKLMSLRY